METLYQHQPKRLLRTLGIVCLTGLLMSCGVKDNVKILKLGHNLDQTTS